MAVKIIKYEGETDVLAWKYPSDELGTWTQVIVNQSQEAILYKSGKALDLFGPGRHTLKTQNKNLLCQRSESEYPPQRSDALYVLFIRHVRMNVKKFFQKVWHRK